MRQHVDTQSFIRRTRICDIVDRWDLTSPARTMTQQRDQRCTDLFLILCTRLHGVDVGVRVQHKTLIGPNKQVIEMERYQLRAPYSLWALAATKTMLANRVGDSTTVKKLDNSGEATNLGSKEVPTAHGLAD
eukprot:COSAG02_NODE_9835_length_2097_cov_1.649650_1_plen_132_part_00